MTRTEVTFKPTQLTVLCIFFQQLLDYVKFPCTIFVIVLLWSVHLIIVKTSVQSDSAQGCTADLSAAVAVNLFVWFWPHLIGGTLDTLTLVAPAVFA